MGGGLLASTLGFWAAYLVPGAALFVLAAALGLTWAPGIGRRRATASFKAGRTRYPRSL
jgi:hypothetical protein